MTSTHARPTDWIDPDSDWQAPPTDRGPEMQAIRRIEPRVVEALGRQEYVFGGSRWTRVTCRLTTGESVNFDVCEDERGAFEAEFTR